MVVLQTYDLAVKKSEGVFRFLRVDRCSVYINAVIVVVFVFLQIQMNNANNLQEVLIVYCITSALSRTKWKMYMIEFIKMDFLWIIADNGMISCISGTFLTEFIQNYCLKLFACSNLLVCSFTTIFITTFTNKTISSRSVLVLWIFFVFNIRLQIPGGNRTFRLF